MTDEREDRLQRYLDRRLDDAARRAFETEMLADAELMAEVYDELAVRDALAETTRTRRSQRFARWGGWIPAGVVALAASLVLIFFLRPLEPRSPAYRGTSGSAPRSVEPVGDVAAPPKRFLWTRDAAARDYRIEIFDQAGARVLVATTADTALTWTSGDGAPLAGSWRATSLDSIGVGFRSTGLVAYSVR